MSKSKTRDYFAELYVSGLFADAGWNVYFPHRDQGFDFIATKAAGKSILIRPVQVKGKYPESEKTNKPTYGYSGKLTAIHEQMVLAIPFFSTSAGSKSPLHTAFMPLSKLSPPSTGKPTKTVVNNSFTSTVIVKCRGGYPQPAARLLSTTVEAPLVDKTNNHER